MAMVISHEQDFDFDFAFATRITCLYQVVCALH